MTTRIDLLGAARLLAPAGPVASPRRQPLVLLAYLALADGDVTRDHLAFLFWPDVPTGIARQRLRRVLSQLREILHTAAVPDLVRTSGEQIAVNHGQCRIDVREFLRLAPAGAAVTTAAIARCEAAVRLYRGPFLAGIALDDAPELDHWLQRTRDRLEMLRQHCLGVLVDGYASAGQTAEAIATAEGLLGLDPLREETHRALMRLYAADGQRAQALRQYRRCVTVLAAELGVEPLDETRALYEALLHDDPPPVRDIAVAWPLRQSLVAPCLGRDAELGALVAILGRGLCGQPAIAGVSGPAGIGKTRLILEATRTLGRPVWLSSGQPAGQGVPYGAVLPALRAALAQDGQLPALSDLWLAEIGRVLPEVRLARPDLRPPANLPPAQAQARLFEGLTRLVGALCRRVGGAILVLDNLEGADPASLSWLADLLREVGDAPLGIAIAYRPSLDASPLGDWLDHLACLDNHRAIVLAPLTREATTDLIDRVGFRARVGADRLWTETGGNPFFLLETLRLLAERDEVVVREAAPLPLPRTVEEVIQGRLRALDQVPRQIIDAAAILVPNCDAELARAVAGRDEMETALALDALVAAALLVEAGSSYQFAHAQIAEVTYAAIGGARRRLLHRRAAAALRTSTEASGAALAHHLERAGQTAAAAAAWLDAAGQSAAVFAAEEALGFLARGLALVSDPAQRCELLALREDLLEHLGRRAEQAADLAELERLTVRLGATHRSLAHFRRGRYLAALGHWDEAEARLRLALHSAAAPLDVQMLLARVLAERQRWDEAEAIGLLALQGAGDGRTRCRALHTLAQLARTREDRGAIENYLRQALDVAPESDTIRPRLLMDLGEVLFREGRHDASLAVTAEALHLAQEQGNRTTEALAHNQMGNCLARLHRNAEALAAFRRAGQAHRAIENRAGQAAAVGNLGVLAMRMGLLEESLAPTAETYQLFEELGNVPGLCLAANNLGTALIWLGRSAEAVPHLELALDRAVSAKLPIREAATRCNLGAAFLDLGRVVEGVALMERGAAMRADLNYGDLCIDHACLAVAYVRVGRLAEAERLSAQALAALVQDTSGVAHPQRVAFGRAQVLRALGRGDEATSVLAEAQHMLERYAVGLASHDERARYGRAFTFNRAISTARQGVWPDPPRLV